MGVATRKRPIGRPRLKWPVQINKDMRQVGGRVQMVEDIYAWKRLVNEAKDRLRYVAAQR